MSDFQLEPKESIKFNTVILYSVEIYLKKKITPQKNTKSGSSLVVQWLGLRAFTAEGPTLIPRWETKILHAARRSLNK